MDVPSLAVYENIEMICENLESANNENIGILKSHHLRRENKEGKIGNDIVEMHSILHDQVHLYILHNSDEVASYVNEYKHILTYANPNKTENWISREHNQYSQLG